MRQKNFKLSTIRELSVHMEVSASYLDDGVETGLGYEKREILAVFGALKNDEIKRVALE